MAAVLGRPVPDEEEAQKRIAVLYASVSLFTERMTANMVNKVQSIRTCDS